MSGHKATSIRKTAAKDSRNKKREHCIHSAPGSFRSIPTTFVAHCSSLTTFPLALRPIVHP
ncbi:hypothetical protein, partial [Klebsiella pneumoniae]|uniref:hypothetical protein n=1 Tax=Klebsiella pneumoniae TaxID=573 RepID=UPI001C6F9B9E